jgi:D-alanine--poly(phosphoribitol) ligase subunit 1
MRATRPENMRYIKRIIFGGEGYPKAKLKQLFDIYSHRIEFHNVYGPTECTCICSSYGVTEDDFRDLQGFLPLGSLIPNFDYLIVDEELMPVEPGQTGELILRGPNVGLGYYSDQERTQEGFIQNPCNDSYREIVYRTGDLAYFNPDDGRIWIVGRRDNQIKHMGYRIELEEIENALSCIDSVKHSAVVHCEIRGLSQIVAFIKSENGRADETEIRCRLQEIIPQYMVPTRFEFLDVLPKNANGKLDRKRLQLEYAGQHANG